jgi:MFS transporter, PHS family, inorganic phosphate transporter
MRKDQSSQNHSSLAHVKFSELRPKETMEPASQRQLEDSFLPNNGEYMNTTNQISQNYNGSSSVASFEIDQPNSLISTLSSPDQITAMLSNFSTSFNVVNISLVLPMLQMKNLYADSVTKQTSSLCASSLIGGMILGQLIGGFLGDFLGRKTAMYFVMTLQIVASLGSAFLVHESFASVFVQLATWRLILGIGCGGVYPLAALLSSESSSSNSSRNQHDDEDHESYQSAPEHVKLASLKKLAATFSLQGVGFLFVPIVSIISLLICGEEHLDLAWRLILAFGSIPGLVLMYLRKKQMNQIHEDEEIASIVSHVPNEDPTDEHALQRSRVSNESTGNQGIWNAIKNEDNLLRKILGTAGTWFLFDIVFYGNTLFQPVVIKTAFGYDNNDDDNVDEYDSMLRNVRDSFLLTMIALPGYFITIALIGRKLAPLNCLPTRYSHFGIIHQTPRFIQIQGFVLMTIVYCIIGYSWDDLTQHHIMLIMLYGSTFFFSNYGPNTTTFMLPSLTFSPDCRSTLSGISAASGKAGALLGSIVFEPLADKYGDGTVMFLCALTSILGAILTGLCTQA